MKKIQNHCSLFRAFLYAVPKQYRKQSLFDTENNAKTNRIVIVNCKNVFIDLQKVRSLN